MRDLNLKALEYFEAVARLGAVTKAAEELSVSPSAVSQQIHKLETQLGAKLFRRERQRLSLTLDGDRLFQTTSQALGSLRNARAAIGRQKHGRTLTVRVSPSFGVRWLGPRIAEFAAANADWNIRVDATPDFTDFETEATDFDLRYGAGDWPGLSVERIMNDLVIPMCSPAYLAWLRGAAETVEDQLAAARLIDSVKMLYRWDVWLAANRIDLPELAYPFRFDRSSMSIEMAKQGGGIALDSASLCIGELERGELVPFAPEMPAVDFPAYWFVCPPRRLSRRIVRRFRDWIGEGAAAHEARVREVLTGLGCRFRPLAEPDDDAAPSE